MTSHMRSSPLRSGRTGLSTAWATIGRARMVVALLLMGTTLIMLPIAGCGAASGGDYPTKSIDMIVPFAPGGTADLVARLTADNMGKRLGQPVNVVNKAGGGGNTGTIEALQAKADGYTILLHTVATGQLNPATQADTPFKWDQPTFVSRINTSPLVLIVKSDSPWKTLKDLVEDIRKDPAKFKLGTAGEGGLSVFASAQILEQAGVDSAKLTRVVFTGGAPAVTAVAGGHIDFAAQNLSEVIDLIKGGKLRGLAISTSSRAKILPETIDLSPDRCFIELLPALELAVQEVECLILKCKVALIEGPLRRAVDLANRLIPRGAEKPGPQAQVRRQLAPIVRAFNHLAGGRPYRLAGTLQARH